jgi:hypothetical protein
MFRDPHSRVSYKVSRSQNKSILRVKYTEREILDEDNFTAKLGYRNNLVVKYIYIIWIPRAEDILKTAIY